jgi:hypothetical protein
VEHGMIDTLEAFTYGEAWPDSVGNYTITSP